MMAGLLAFGMVGTPVRANETALFTYTPPERGAPAARIGGASRGAATALEVLLPAHVAWTVSPQPVLYWFVSEPVTTPVEVTVGPHGAVTPVFSRRLEEPVPAGLHAVVLARDDVTLEPDTIYDLSVAILSGPDRPTVQHFARGSVQRVPLPDPLLERLAGTGPAAKAGLLAEAGLWVDGLRALRDAVEKGEATPADLADALAAQGLDHTAAFLRKNDGS